VPSEGGVECGTVTVAVKHLKARHTQPKDLLLDFDRRTQRFTEAEDPRTWKPGGSARPARQPKSTQVQSALAAAWAKTPSADDDADASSGSGDESW
jgi:hypothetical protein